MKRLVASLAAVAVPLAALLWYAWPDAPAPVAAPAGSAVHAPAAARARGPLDVDRARGDAANEPRAAVPSPAIVLEGRVVDGASIPLVDIAVHALADPLLSPFALLRQQQRGDRWQPIGSAVSDRDGSFRITVPPGAGDEPLRLVALGVRHGDAGLRRVRATGPRTVVPDLVLPGGCRVTGSVVDDANDQPVAGARVTAFVEADRQLDLPGRSPGRTTVTDASGVFVFSALAPGTYTFQAAATEHASGELRQQVVSGDEPAEVHLALGAGLTIAGHVVDGAGAPVPDATVAAVPLAAAALVRIEARTDGVGRFVLQGAGAGSWQLTIGKRGFATLVVPEPVAAPSPRLVYTLRPQGALRLRVVDGGGAAVAPFDVAARPAGPAAGLRALPVRRVTRDELDDGACVLDDLDPGAWLLEVVASGFAATPCGPVAVGEGTVADATAVLRSGASVRVRAVSADARPVAGAAVASQPDGFLDGALGEVFAPLHAAGLARPAAVSGADGTATLHHVPAGTYQLRLDAPGALPFYVRGVVVGDADVDLGVVTLPPGSRLRGRVRIEGAAARDVVVQVLALRGGNLPQGYRVEAAVGADGTWACTQTLPPGRYAVMAGRRRADDPFLENQDHAASRTEVELRTGDPERSIDLQLPRRGS